MNVGQGAEILLVVHACAPHCLGRAKPTYVMAASTMRTPLKSLFAKTGTLRQEDLVMPLPTAPPIGPNPA